MTRPYCYKPTGFFGRDSPNYMQKEGPISNLDLPEKGCVALNRVSKAGDADSSPPGHRDSHRTVSPRGEGGGCSWAVEQSRGGQARWGHLLSLACTGGRSPRTQTQPCRALSGRGLGQTVLVKR